MPKKVRPKILIADDEPSIRDALKAILAGEKYNVVMARNGKEAVELFKKESPDLVILDMSMPYLNGLQVMAKIRKFFGERYIPVLFLTVSNEKTHKISALHGGAVDYLTKPVSPEELCARIRNFLEIKARHDQLKAQAVYDWMTGAMHKGPFLNKAKEELARAVRNKTPLSFIFLDIDHFKRINDTTGHLAGDAVISECGARLRKMIRNIDLLGRFGGDEFMIMLPHKGKDEALIVAQRISRVMKGKPFRFEKEKFVVTTSQGIVSIETSKKVAISALIQLADEALYEAKAQRGDCYVLKTIP